MNLTLFDLDNTLLAGDSDFEWAQFLIEQGVAEGSFRRVNATFVGEVVAATIVRIHHGDIAAACKFTDADAFAELAQVVLHGVSAAGQSTPRLRRPRSPSVSTGPRPEISDALRSPRPRPPPR